MRFLFVLACFASLPAFAQDTLIQHITGRRVESLDGAWQYLIDPYGTGYYDYRHQPLTRGGYFEDRQPKDSTQFVEYDFDHAPSLQVPGDWNSQDPKLLYYEGILWYRRQFSAAALPGHRYFLYFGAVNYAAHVYLNGRPLGDHYGGFTPFQFEVTGLLKSGVNSLVLMVDNTRHQDDVPTVNTDWWNYGGITRDVYLADMPSGFIRDYSLHLDPRHPDRIVGYVVASGSDVEISIPDAGLHWTAHSGVPFSIPAPNLQKWSPGNPFLYDVHLRSATDSVSDRIGFRTITVKGQDILLNGKSIFLKGICIHDENPLIPGRSRGEGDLRMLLEWAKELHCNYVRLAHYPHNEAMLRLADEMGLLVWAEIPVYWTISFDNPGTFAEAAGQLTGMVSRDKNRASVIIWSVGNETPVTASRLRFMGNLADSARALDATRLVTAAMEVRTQGRDMTVDDPLAAKLDLVSFNEYRGWYSGGLNDIEGVHFHIAYQKPVVISEFGGEALGGFHGDSTARWTEEYQEALYVHQLRLLSTLDGLRGMTPWILVDFRSPRRLNSVYQNGWNRKGLISSDGQKKKAFFVVRSFYDHIHD